MRNDAPATRREPRGGWLAPAGLILLVLVPVLAGAVRLGELTGLTGAHGAAGDRPAGSAVPLAVHIVSVTVYGLVGAFQFSPRFRRRRPKWHRAAGRVLVACGLAGALSALWLTLFSVLPPGDTGLLTVFRLVFGTAMLGSIVLGFAAARRRDFARHRAWMTRGYAIGLGAGTQALTQAAWIVPMGPPGGSTRALLLGAGWAINLAVAEWVIRRERPSRSGSRPAIRSAPGSAPRSAIRSARHPLGLEGPHGDLHPVTDADLGHQAGDVTLHRAE
ncbi:DUF2306 domain-containing protein [Spongiactinospora sp. TRM90649]|uniref:DUF2306 domain-containing protein n=1 Tax=Spongiactinospora sp. TRM90649 TaxID=3031114 RepID=UPI0023F79426|nr:DUF2306 domain-containing protein [Spongiactinospora sp. TRM90649]MDF5756288.1 DUF2306 domain-containing protein [Spongiactinospora sp. TRM90649]